jgi:hypothetical protein
MIPTIVRITITMSKMFHGSRKNLMLKPINFIVSSSVKMIVSVKFRVSNDYESASDIPYH